MRPEITAGRSDARRFGLSPDRPVLTVMGGSQGAEGLNDRVIRAAPVFARRGVQILHLSGPHDEERVRRAYEGAGVRATVLAFTAEMGHVYATADLALCRAGGTTVAELAATGTPAVFVPYPHHADRHQELNAEVLVRAGAARIVPEAELTPSRLETEVADLFINRSALDAMAAAARRSSVPGAAQRVADWAREIVAEAHR